MRQMITLVVSVLVSAGLVWLVLQDVPLAEVSQTITRANPLWALASVGSVVMAVFLRAERWCGLLDRRMSFWDSFWIMGITFVLNQLPFRAGEIARSLLATRRGIPVFTAATSIIIERLLDTVLVVVLLAIGIAQLPNVSDDITNSAIFFGIAAVGGFGVLLFFAHRPQIPQNILDWFNENIPLLQRIPLDSLLSQVLEGIQPLTRWRTLAHAVIWTILSWIPSLMILYTAVRALDIQTAPIQLTILGVSLASLSIAVPVTVASIGLIEGAIKVAGNLVNVPDVASTALGFLFHGLLVLGYILVGVPGIALMGVSLSDVFKQTQNSESPTEPT